MTASPVRIGRVGYGKGGRWFHAPLIEHAQGCELAGVVVRSPQRRAELAAEGGRLGNGPGEPMEAASTAAALPSRCPR
jgi:predicted dehydrogenase